MQHYSPEMLHIVFKELSKELLRELLRSPRAACSTMSVLAKYLSCNIHNYGDKEEDEITAE
jgi:hypothetical protein